MYNDDSALLERLTTASAGLTMMSEIDHPFEPFLWERADHESLINSILKQSGQPEDVNIETVELEEFFQNSTQDQSWHGEKEQAEVAQFRSLSQLLKSELTQVKVYRLGTIYIDVYIAGIAPSGSIVGLKTKLLET